MSFHDMSLKPWIRPKVLVLTLKAHGYHGSLACQTPLSDIAHFSQVLSTEGRGRADVQDQRTCPEVAYHFNSQSHSSWDYATAPPTVPLLSAFTVRKDHMGGGRVKERHRWCGYGLRASLALSFSIKSRGAAAVCVNLCPSRTGKLLLSACQIFIQKHSVRRRVFATGYTLQLKETTMENQEK